jgi:ribosomal protein L24
MKIKSNNQLKIGDSVKVISGTYINKIGFISQIFLIKRQIIIKDFNKKTQNKKPYLKCQLGEKHYNEFPIHYSNVKIIRN